MKCKIIKASAGTGKTYTMALEYIKSLNNKVSYNEILVITFTKKATAEIRERVLLFLRKIAFREKGYETLIKTFSDIDYQHLKKCYEEMLKNSENIKISTIDSFTNQIFSKVILPHKNISSYETIDGHSELYLFEVLNEFMKRDITLFNKFFKLTKGNTIENKTSYIETILNNKFSLYNICMSKKYLKKLGTYTYEEAFKRFKNEYLILDNKYFLKPINTLMQNEGTEIDLSRKSNHPLFSSASLKKLDKEIIDKFELLYEDLITASIDKDIIDYNNLFRDVARLVYEIDDELKFRKKKFTFEDIAFYTEKYLKDEDLKLLENGKAGQIFYETIGHKIDTIMIDEFQDTNFNQLKLFLPIFKSCNNILLVGDEKQSIYGFRGSNSLLFRNISKVLSDLIDDIDIEEKTLETSYRSKSAIIDYVNNYFSNKDNFSYENVKYVENGGSVNVVKIEEEKELIDIIKNNEEILSKSCILARTNDNLDKFTKLLSENNLAYSVVKKVEITKDKDVQAILSLITYLVTKNKYELFKFLRSDIIGFSLNRLKKYIENPNIEDNIILKIKELEKDSSDFKRKYIEFFGYNNNVLNVEQLLNLVETKLSLREFYEEKDVLLKSIKQAPIKEATGIELMSMHQSKGLEFDTVYVYINMKKSIVKDYTLLKIENDLFETEDAIFIKKLKLLSLNSKTNKWVDLYYQKEELENLNLLYVALTRPKTNLYIVLKDDNSNIFRDSFDEIQATLDVSIEETDKIKDISLNMYKPYFEKTKYEYLKNSEHSLEKEFARKEGLAVHYFMEKFRYYSDIDYAKSMFFKKYGNLVGPIKSSEIFDRCIRFYNDNKEIFSNELEVYTEYEIEYEGESYRIDRLNIDRLNKIIYIYDYKTLKDPYKKDEYIRQINKYIEIFKEEFKDYEILGELLSI